MSGNLHSLKKSFIALGMAIYGDDDPDLRSELEQITFMETLASGKPDDVEEARHKLRTALQTQYPTGKNWIALFKKRGEIIPGFGITKIGNMFGVRGNVIGIKRDFVELGIAVYGEHDPDLQAERTRLAFNEKLTSEKPEEVEAARTELRTHIKRLHPDGKAWLRLFTKAGDIVPDFGIVKLANIFGIDGKVRHNRRDFIALGIAIYGEAEFEGTP